MPGQLWNIGFSAWMVHDGNYDEFAVGHTAEFAVEFYQKPATTVTKTDRQISAIPISDCAYHVIAAKRLRSEKMTVLDIGILVYREHDCEEPCLAVFDDAERGETDLELGVDPYFYFEYLHKTPGVPPLIYSWRMASILRQTAPFIEVESGPASGQKAIIRDPEKLGYEHIPRTDGSRYDKGLNEYVLECELLPVAARYTLSRLGSGY